MSGGWHSEVESYLLYLTVGGAPATTVSLRRYHLRRLARAAPAGPLTVDGDALIAWLGSHDWSPATLRSHRQTLRSFFGWMVHAGHRSDNPAEALPRVRPTPPAPRPVGHDDYRMALALAGPRERLMMRLAGELGLRRAEVAVVHRDDLVEDLTGWSLRVHGKGGKVRVLPLPDGLARAILTADPGYLFPGRVEGHVSPAWVGRVVSRHLPPGYSMHKLRHMFATDAYSIDQDLFTVQDLLGHASPVTTRAYVLIPQAARRRLMEQLQTQRLQSQAPRTADPSGRRSPRPGPATRRARSPS